MDRFKVSSPACVPAGRTLVARGNATAKRTGFPPRPAAFPTIAPGGSPGWWVRCVPPPGEPPPPGAGPRAGRKGPRRGLLVNTPAPLTFGGAAEDLEGLET